MSAQKTQLRSQIKTLLSPSMFIRKGKSKPAMPQIPREISPSCFFYRSFTQQQLQMLECVPNCRFPFPSSASLRSGSRTLFPTGSLRIITTRYLKWMRNDLLVFELISPLKATTFPALIQQSPRRLEWRRPQFSQVSNGRNGKLMALNQAEIWHRCTTRSCAFVPRE